MEKCGRLIYWKAKTLRSLGRDNDALDILEGKQLDNVLAAERIYLKSLILYDFKKYEESMENLLNFKMSILVIKKISKLIIN